MAPGAGGLASLEAILITTGRRPERLSQKSCGSIPLMAHCGIQLPISPASLVME